MRNTSHEISGDDFVSNQTKAIERKYKCSNPRPRNRAMGFKGEEKKKFSVDGLGFLKKQP